MLSGPWAKRALGPLSSGSKDHGTHNAPFSPVGTLCFFSWGKYCVLNLEYGRLKGLENLCVPRMHRKVKRVWSQGVWVAHIS